MANSTKNSLSDLQVYILLQEKFIWRAYINWKTSMKVLIFSSEWDLHARAISWALNSRNVAAKILDPTRFPSHTRFSLQLNTSQLTALTYKPAGELVGNFDLQSVGVVWCRRMMSKPKILDFSSVHQDDLNNVIADSVAFITGMWHFVKGVLGPNVPWLNPVQNLERAASKALQLQIAHEVGFVVPATIIGNDPVAIREFFQSSDGAVVMKPFLQKGWVENNKTLLQSTVEITQADLKDDAPLQLCPAIYQTLVKKQFELRVVVLGDKIIAAKLDSQAHEHTCLDWRIDAYKQVMAITPYQFHADEEQKIHLFMQRIGLHMGSLDFIVDEKGDLVFLEVNEQGQFLFLEAQCPELRLMAEVSDFLVKTAQVAEIKNWPSFAEYLKTDDYAALVAEQKNYYAHEIREVRYCL